MAKSKWKIEGMKELKKSIKKLGQVPQKHVTSSARKGMNIALKDAKKNAPYETGALEQGIVMKGEKSRVKAKKVYRIVFDRAMNDVFQKKNAEGKVIAYYPVSQEYGYFLRNGKYMPGLKFVHNALDNNKNAIERKIVTTMKEKIDKEISKAGLK